MDDWQAITLAEQENRLHWKRFAQPKEQRIHIIPDTHIPFQHQPTLDAAISAAHSADIIIQIGDGVDAYPVTSHLKNPERRHTLQEECDEYRVNVLAKLRFQNPDARIIQIKGNHEERLDKYMWRRAPELATLRCLNWARLLHCNRLGIELHERSGLYISGHRIKHGIYAKAGAGNSARAEMEAHRVDGVSGHTHRKGRASRTDKEGRTTTWHEIGHTQDWRATDYITEEPDWCLSAGLTIIIGTNGEVRYEECTI